jgi:hypothetical protein
MFWKIASEGAKEFVEGRLLLKCPKPNFREFSIFLFRQSKEFWPELKN